MSIRIPTKSLGDRILDSLGKKRAVKIPEGAYEKYGPYVYAKFQKESFWRALIRQKGKNPPIGYTYLDNYSKRMS